MHIPITHKRIIFSKRFIDSSISDTSVLVEGLFWLEGGLVGILVVMRVMGVVRVLGGFYARASGGGVFEVEGVDHCFFGGGYWFYVCEGVPSIRKEAIPRSRPIRSDLQITSTRRRLEVLPRKGSLPSRRKLRKVLQNIRINILLHIVLHWRLRSRTIRLLKLQIPSHLHIGHMIRDQIALDRLTINLQVLPSVEVLHAVIPKRKWDTLTSPHAVAAPLICSSVLENIGRVVPGKASGDFLLRVIAVSMP